MKKEKLLLLLTVARMTDDLSFLLSESKKLLAEEIYTPRNNVLSHLQDRYNNIFIAAQIGMLVSADYNEKNKIFIAWASIFKEYLLELFNSEDISLLTTDLLWYVTKGKRIISPINYDIFSLSEMVLNELFSDKSQEDENGNVYYPLAENDLFSFHEYPQTEEKNICSWAKKINLRKYTQDIYRYEIDGTIDTFVVPSSVIRAYLQAKYE